MGCKHGVEGACTACGSERYVAALRKDAERYSWLRSHHQALCCEATARALGLDLSKVYVNTPEKLDAVIDAAMAPRAQSTPQPPATPAGPDALF